MAFMRIWIGSRSKRWLKKSSQMVIQNKTIKWVKSHGWRIWNEMTRLFRIWWLDNTNQKSNVQTKNAKISRSPSIHSWLYPYQFLRGLKARQLFFISHQLKALIQWGTLWNSIWKMTRFWTWKSNLRNSTKLTILSTRFALCQLWNENGFLRIHKKPQIYYWLRKTSSTFLRKR